MAWYENWFDSPYYKILYQDRDDLEAAAFVEKLLKLLDPQAGSLMLDIACGDGRFARQLAGHGYDVTGIDLSHCAIEVAKAHEADNLHFYIQDMRMPFYINYYDYAFNFFTSFGYFRYDRDHKLAARSFAACLKKGGTLVIDYFNYEYVRHNLVSAATVHRGSYTFDITKRDERRHIVKDISFTDADGKHRTYKERVAGFSPSDFKEMFGSAGLQLLHIFGDYQLTAYDEQTSPRMVMVFKKA